MIHVNGYCVPGEVKFSNPCLVDASLFFSFSFFGLGNQAVESVNEYFCDSN